jgi:hypothetical protein
MRRAVQARRDAPEFGRGRPLILETDHSEVFAHATIEDDEFRGRRTTFAVHNLSAEPHTVRVDVSGLDEGPVVSLFPDLEEVEAADGEMTLELGRYGYRWLRLKEHED